jgi:predicted MFS family arabinose efflux permease
MKRVIALYKASYSGLAPASWWLSAVMLVNRSGTMVVPFMTLYLTVSLHYSISQAGIVFGIFGAGAICGGFIGGRLADRFGFYAVQLITLSCGGLLFMLLGQMRSYAMICLFTFLLAVVNESFRPANSLAIAHYSKEENRTRSYSLNRLAINLGWALGGSLGGFIAAHNYNLLFIIDGCTNIGAAIMLRIFLAPAKQAKADKPIVQKAPRFEAYRDTHYMIFTMLVLVYAFAFFQIFSTLPVYYRKSLHLSEEVIGLTMAGNGILIALFEMVLVFRLEGRRHPLQYIPVGALLVALSFIIFNIIPGGVGVAIVSTVLVTAGEMCSMPFMNTYWLSRTNDGNRGQYAGLYTVAWAMAQVLGPATGAGFADRFGFTALWWAIGGIAVSASLGYWLLHRAEDKTVTVVSARTE